MLLLLLLLRIFPAKRTTHLGTSKTSTYARGFEYDRQTQPSARRGANAARAGERPTTHEPLQHRAEILHHPAVRSMTAREDPEDDGLAEKGTPPPEDLRNVDKRRSFLEGSVTSVLLGTTKGDGTWHSGHS